MKFGRVLRDSADCSPDLPELRALFDAYKQLKKQVKAIPVVGAASTTLAAEQLAFGASLGGVVARLNDMWLEKEETSVIRVEALEAALAGAGRDVARLDALRRELTDFHGEVLLLVHWSILAYTATVKLLKKHHKRTGLLLNAPLGNLLSQPFCSTEVGAMGGTEGVTCGAKAALCIDGWLCDAAPWLADLH
ncbi:hypothetical protein MNEG_0186 [Monoraphidium neglectum]|jgi:SPX domain protein involved in polyphosphate accumulation|uniref:SPX domain-containing protein n=1 Tax=Monoraphidium neglectum TaxID=145388 RepID=A0A0D2N663_9CHLO|nr:hypothetical protein MNEG_0186 [Monoraphidium neglectum]KIZ07767.1 hypothetical protein MNEG_0186 [Monoraphidium neglectum]|eukprot:XP_013906786.1 hypothetical protein MNEG_0186 [Monoraphidium neglectum]